MKDYQKRGLIAVAMVLLGFAVVVLLNSVLSDDMKPRIIGLDVEKGTYLSSIQTMMWIAFLSHWGSFFIVCYMW